MSLMQHLRYLRHKWLASLWLVLGRTRAADELFDRMLSEFPADEYAMASRAHRLVQAGRREEGERLLADLVRLHPHDARHWFNLGFVREELGDHGGAETALCRAVELNPSLDRAWYGLGLVLIHLRRFDEAVLALKKNTQLQPMSPYGWYQLARVHVDRHEPEEARKIIRHLQRFEPKVAAQLERETGISVHA